MDLEKIKKLEAELSQAKDAVIAEMSNRVDEINNTLASMGLKARVTWNGESAKTPAIQIVHRCSRCGGAGHSKRTCHKQGESAA